MRIARWLHLAGTILLVLLIVGLALIGYSALGIKANTPSGGSSSTTSFANNAITQTTSANLTNGGLVPISGLTFDVIAYVIGGPVVGESSAPGVTVNPGASYHIPIVVNISVAPSSPGQQLLVSNATIGVEGWLNATAGYLLSVSIGISPGNQSSWHAPFAGFGVQVVQSGSSAQVTVTFANYASVPVEGTMLVTLANSAGTTCGTASVSVTPPVMTGSSFSGSATASLSSGCTPATAVATITGTAPTTYSFTLPQVNVS